MEAFRDGLEDCYLTDLGYNGPTHTCSYQRLAPHNVRCRLDRFCGTQEWCNLAPSAWVQHLPHPGSDHTSILLHLRG